MAKTTTAEITMPTTTYKQLKKIAKENKVDVISVIAQALQVYISAYKDITK